MMFSPLFLAGFGDELVPWTGNGVRERTYRAVEAAHQIQAESGDVRRAARPDSMNARSNMGRIIGVGHNAVKSLFI
jgi:hypothetical protein